MDTSNTKQLTEETMDKEDKEENEREEISDEMDSSDGENKPSFHFPQKRNVRTFSSPSVLTRSGRHCLPLKLLSGTASIQGLRKTQEDAHTNVPELKHPQKKDQINKKEKVVDLPFAFFGIFDGHGGDKASDFVCKTLHNKFSEVVHELAENEDESSIVPVLRPALIKAFEKVEKEWMDGAQESKDCSGSTAAVVVIKDNHLVVGNVGDSEVVLCENGNAKVLSELHNPKKNKAEGERVKKEGGVLFHDRVGHPLLNPALMSIAVSRAIGDYGFKAKEYTGNKESGLSAIPYIQELSLKPMHTFCIIACDGVFDVLSAQETVDYVNQKLQEVGTSNPEAAAEALVQYAYDRGSTDNISASIVVFQWLPNSSPSSPKIPLTFDNKKTSKNKKEEKEKEKKEEEEEPVVMIMERHIEKEDNKE